MVDRDAVDDLLDDIVGAVPDHEDMSIVELFVGDVEALAVLETTLPRVQGLKIRCA